jgi:hypothetical protein
MTDDELIQQAKLYSTRGAWLKDHPAAYLLAKRRGVFEQAVAHMPLARRCTKAHGARLLPRKYTEKQLMAAAARFSRRSDWDRQDSKTYRAAMNMGLLDRLCAHMAPPGKVRKQRSDVGHAMVNRQEYPDNVIRDSALQFSTRKEWREVYPQHYRAALHRGIIDQVAGHQFVADPVNLWRVYRYEFPDRSAYVGITSNSLHIRHLSHCFRGAVRKRARVLRLREVPLPRLLAETTFKEAKRMEDEWIARCKAEGWSVINQKEGGDKGPLSRMKLDGVVWEEFGQNMRVIVVTGAPGSGKTWLMRQLTGAYLIETDAVGRSQLHKALAIASQQPLPIVMDVTVRALTLRRQFNRVEFKMAVITEALNVVRDRIVARGGEFTPTVARRVRRAFRLARQADFSGTAADVLAWVQQSINHRRSSER